MSALDSLQDTSIDEKELQQLAEMHWLLLQPDKNMSASQIIIDAFKAGYRAKNPMKKLPNERKDMVRDMTLDLLNKAVNFKQIEGLADLLVSFDYGIRQLESQIKSKTV